jgi:hypothetical protein
MALTSTTDALFFSTGEKGQLRFIWVEIQRRRLDNKASKSLEAGTFLSGMEENHGAFHNPLQARHLVAERRERPPSVPPQQYHVHIQIQSRH